MAGNHSALHSVVVGSNIICFQSIDEHYLHSSGLFFLYYAVYWVFNLTLEHEGVIKNPTKCHLTPYIYISLPSLSLKNIKQLLNISLRKKSG